MLKENPEENIESFPAPIGSREVIEQEGVRCANCGKIFNRERIFCPVCGLRHTEDANLPSDTLILKAGLEHSVRSCRIFSLLSFILGIAGPLAIGIGWLLAIIFGFTALGIIRTKGGFARDRKFALWGITLGFMWPVIIGFSILIFSYRSMTGKRIQKNEISIMNELRNIAITQRYVKSGHFFDRDNDGESEYADFTDLSKVEYIYFDPDTVSGEKHGYGVQMTVLKEKGFRIVAHPQIYRTTGRRSFYIDEGGFLRGGDIKGERSFREWEKLSKINKDSIFDEFDDEISGDLLNLAKKLAKERSFSRARKILTEIKESFYMSPVVSGVSNVIENINTYIAEDKAKETYREALKLMNGGEYRIALTMLKDIEKTYPDTVIIPDAKREMGEIERVLAEILEQEAKELFLAAQNLELQGKYDEALIKYQKIVNELDSTSYLSRVKNLLPAAKRKLEERKAEALFSHLSELEAEGKHTELLHTISVLTDHYSESDLVKKNKDYLNLLQATATGYIEKIKAEQEFQKQHFHAAIQAGESALRVNPGLEKELKSLLQASYVKLAEGYFKNKSFTSAVPYYEKWMKLSMQEGSDEHKHYIESLYQLGKSDYLAGRYKEAKGNLSKLRQYLAGSGEFWYLLGNISAAEEDYKGAMRYFKYALRIDDSNLKAWYKKGLCRLPLIQKLDEELSSQLKELNSLKRGLDIVMEATAIINDLNARHIELKLQAKPKVLQDKTQLTTDQILKKKLTDVERSKFLTQLRTRTYAVESGIQKNQGIREKTLSTTKRICDSMSVVYSNIEKASSSDDLDTDMPGLAALIHKKKQYFTLGYTQFEIGLNREKRLEEKAMRCLKYAVSAFGKSQSISDYTDEMNGLHESLSRLQMSKHISDGNELIKKAISVKISLKDYLTGTD